MAQKEIICLANSRKEGGRCIAGKDIETGQWIRPVSNPESGELSIDQITCSNGKQIELLDIIKIYYGEMVPTKYQPENILVGDKQWVKTDKFKKSNIDKLCDHPNDIWLMGEHQDKISADVLKKKPVKSSLLFIKPDSFKVKVKDVSYSDRGRIVTKKKVRAVFDYNKKEYDFGITEHMIDDVYKNKKEGIYELAADKIYLCISLAEPFKKDNYCYKLVASIITV